MSPAFAKGGGQKVLCNVCLIGKFIKWLYERSNHMIKSMILVFTFKLIILLWRYCKLFFFLFMRIKLSQHSLWWLFCELSWNVANMFVMHNFHVKLTWSLANCLRPTPGIGILELNHCQQKTVYSNWVYLLGKWVLFVHLFDHNQILVETDIIEYTYYWHKYE